jgi:hypothetical protein
LSANWARRLSSPSLHALVLAVVLLAQVSFDRWQMSSRAVCIDFFTLWSVPHLVGNDPVQDIYSIDAQRKMGAAVRADAARPGTPLIQRQAAAVTDELYGGRVDATGTPFAYTLVGSLSSGEYTRDLRRFIVVSWAGFFAAVVMLCRLLGFSVLGTVLALMVFTSSFAPLLAELRVANVNQLQLFAVASFIVLLARGRLGLAGFVLGLAVLFKPNVAWIPVLGGLIAVADQDFRRARRVALGAVAAGAAVLGVTTLYFGTPQPWVSFVGSLRRTLDVTYPLDNGNLGLSTLLFSLTNWHVSALLSVVFLVAFGVLAVRTRAKGPSAASSRLHSGLPAGDAFVIAGAGCAVMLLTSNLAWLHYYILMIPLALYLLRPPADGAGLPPWRLAGIASGAMGLVMLSSPAQALAGRALNVAVLVNGATLILLVAALDDFRRERGARLPAESPSRKRQRSREKSLPKLHAPRAFAL